MMKTPPGRDQALLRRIAATARRQRIRLGTWPRRIRVDRWQWHLCAPETYQTNAGGRDLEACFTFKNDKITPGAAASVAAEQAALLIV